MLQELLQEAKLSSDVIVAPKPLSKQEAVMMVRSRFSTYFFDESRCEEGVRKLSLYRKKYDQAKECFIDNPVHDKNSHAADAMSTEALSRDLQDDMLMPEKSDILTDFNPLNEDF